jgi:hypothetical protein
MSCIQSTKINTSSEKVNYQYRVEISLKIKFSLFIPNVCSVEITYRINSIISKLMTFVEKAETGQFLFLVILITSLAHDVILF